MIKVNNLAFTYPGGRQLNFGSFKIDHGNHSLILGSSGSGKTTLLHLLGGLLRGYEGSLLLKGVELSSLSDPQLDRFRGSNIGFVFQRMHLLRSLSVEQNLMVAPWLSGQHSSPGRAKEIVSYLGLADKLESNVSSLSQGQLQRVAIARAVMNKPPLILADEPTSALDDNNCEDVLRLLLSVANESGATLIIATHDQRLKSRIGHQITVKAA